MLEPFFAPNRLRGQRAKRQRDTHVHCDDDADCCLRVQQPAVLVVSGRHHRPAPDGLQGASAAAARSRATRRAAGWGRVGRWVGGWRSRHNADAARTTTKLTEGKIVAAAATGRKVSRVFGNSPPSRHWLRRNVACGCFLYFVACSVEMSMGNCPTLHLCSFFKMKSAEN
jgi:hypothetical protein